jgi:hypothetical protein
LEISELDFGNYAELYAQRKRLFSGGEAQERLEKEGERVADQIAGNVEARVKKFMAETPGATAEQIHAEASQAYIDAQNKLQQQIIDRIDGKGMGFRGALRKFGKLMDMSSMKWKDIGELEGAEKAKAIAMKLGKNGLFVAGIAGLGAIGIGALTSALSISFVLGTGTAIGAAKGAGIGSIMSRHGSKNSAIRGVDLSEDENFQRILADLNPEDQASYGNISDWILKQRNNVAAREDNRTNRRKTALAASIGAIAGAAFGSIQISIPEMRTETETKTGTEHRMVSEQRDVTVQDPGHNVSPQGQDYSFHHIEGNSNVIGQIGPNGEMSLSGGDLSAFGPDGVGTQVGGAYDLNTHQFYPFPNNTVPAGYDGPIAWGVENSSGIHIVASEARSGLFDLDAISQWVPGGSRTETVTQFVMKPFDFTYPVSHDVPYLAYNAALTTAAHLAGDGIIIGATRLAADQIRPRTNRSGNGTNGVSVDDLLSQLNPPEPGPAGSAAPEPAPQIRRSWRDIMSQLPLRRRQGTTETGPPNPDGVDTEVIPPVSQFTRQNIRDVEAYFTGINNGEQFIPEDTRNSYLEEAEREGIFATDANQPVQLADRGRQLFRDYLNSGEYRGRQDANPIGYGFASWLANRNRQRSAAPETAPEPAGQPPTSETTPEGEADRQASDELAGTL